MIDVICSTQLEAFSREDWPTEMVCRPNIGDCVQAVSGKKLYIMDITHSFSKRGKPYLQVELHSKIR